MQVQTKFLWLRQPAALGDRIEGWQESWIGGLDRCRVFFVVMVVEDLLTTIVQELSNRSCHRGQTQRRRH